MTIPGSVDDGQCCVLRFDFFSFLELQRGAVSGKENECIGTRTAFGSEKEIHISATALETQAVDITYMPWWIKGVRTYRS